MRNPPRPPNPPKYKLTGLTVIFPDDVIHDVTEINHYEIDRNHLSVWMNNNDAVEPDLIINLDGYKRINLIKYKDTP